MIGDSMYYIGGADASTFYNDVHELRIGTGATPQQLYAYGEGAAHSNAGVTSTFSIQARENIINNGSAVWGSSLAWGTNLRISAVLTSDQFSALVSAAVVDVGDGLYNVSYTLFGGSSYQLFIQLNGVDIPSSPFHITNIPSSLSPAHCAIVTPQLSLPNAQHTIVVQAADQYGTALMLTADMTKTMNVSMFMS